MSNAIRYDPLLVRRVAAELNERLAGQELRALSLDADSRELRLVLADATLVWQLHPTRGNLTWTQTPDDPDAIKLPRGSAITIVGAPFDERIITLGVRARATSGAVLRSVIVELMTNQWNALALDDESRILTLLWRREAGGRALQPGAVYSAPAARAPRREISTQAEWRELLGDVHGANARERLLQNAAYSSPMNVGFILGARPDGADASFERYRDLLDNIIPCVLPHEGLLQPYSHPLGRKDARVATSMLDAFALSVSGREEPAQFVSSETLAALQHRIHAVEGRIRKLNAEAQNAAPEALKLRSNADLLLSQLSQIPRGAHTATLSDYMDGTVTVELDPAHSAAENAALMYETARKRERAAERMPALIAKAQQELARAQALYDAALRGEAAPEQIAAATARAPDKQKQRPAPALPYRTYRTSGGLEVRVGRNRRSNDDLTFHHSSPNDIWLHARDVGGAHVVLRWADAQGNPPARDLHEAGVLAALHSKARTSGTVPVDWTRRKYVRKPRKAPPGSVLLERAKTLFVEPNEELEKRLRVGDEEGGP